ncbi:hypothetical protein GCM10009562_25500 [Nocardioides aquaticus]
MPDAAIDYQPLRSRPASRDPQEAGRAPGPRGSTLAGGMVGGLLVVVGAVTTLLGVLGGDGDVALGLVMTGCGALIGLLVGLLARLQDRRGDGRTARLAAFAHANGLDHDPRGPASDLPGALRPDVHATAWNRVTWSVGGASAESATYHGGSTGTVPNAVRLRYLAVRLDLDLPDLTFRCGRHGPAFAEERRGPDLLQGRPCSLRAGGLRTDERATVLFSDRVVALLTDRDHGGDAEYVGGWFLAHVRDRDELDAGSWAHLFALADNVAAARTRWGPHR